MSQSQALPAGYLEAFRRRVIADALAQATAGYWLRRAQTFDAAAHQRGDWPGLASADQLHIQRARCVLTALACRQRAALHLFGGDLP